MKKAETLFEAIGNTPLVRIPLKTQGSVYAKLEYLNIGGSIKDRSALFMIEAAEKEGTLKPGATIIEASSGNQGIAVAMIGAAKGYKVIITVSDKISKEKLATIKSYGAEVVVCPSTDFIADPRGYHCQAKILHERLLHSVFLNQYFNLQNPQAHYSTLGPELWEQTGGTITHFFAAAGTGGVISGVGKYLKERNSRVKIIAVDTATSFRSTGGKPKPYKMEGIGIDFKTPCLNELVIDEFIPVTDEQGLGMLPVLSAQYGFLVGPSSGAVAYALESYASKLTVKDTAVIVFADSGRAYLSKSYYS
jgi:cystathionine beta-synthase